MQPKVFQHLPFSDFKFPTMRYSPSSRKPFSNRSQRKERTEHSRIHQRAVHQITRPNHCSRPYKPPSTNPRQAIPQHLIRDRKQDLKRPPKTLSIENLRTDQHICGIDRTPGIRSIRHDNNDSVFLRIELARRKVKAYIQDSEHAVGEDEIPATTEGVGDELDHESG